MSKKRQPEKKDLREDKQKKKEELRIRKIEEPSKFISTWYTNQRETPLDDTEHE